MNDLEGWRKQIDLLDEEMLTLLAKRVELVKEIGKFKKKQNIPILDKNRREKVFASAVAKSVGLGLSKDFTGKFFKLIHQYSLKIQKESI